MTTLRLSALAPFTLAATLFAGTFVHTDASAPVAQEEAAAPTEEAEKASPLHESMETLQKGMKSMRKMLTKPEQKAAGVALCADMQRAAVTGFLNAPEEVEGLAGTELLAYRADFKKRMLTVAGALIDLELALDKEDAAAAKLIYRSLGKEKKEGHDIYIK